MPVPEIHLKGRRLHLEGRHLRTALLAIAIGSFVASPAAAQSPQSAEVVAQQPELAAAVAQYRRALEEYGKASETAG
jgi:hypothetical protein